MLRSIFKTLVILVILAAITVFGGLVIMAGVAGTHDVKPIPIPNNSSLAPIADMWDYSDAFRRPMEYVSYRDIAEIVTNAPFKGDGEIHRSKHEVVFAGTLPGINYQVSYMLDRESFPPAVQLVTMYKIKDKKGRYFFKVWRLVHRCLAPYTLDKLASQATH